MNNVTKETGSKFNGNRNPGFSSSSDLSAQVQDFGSEIGAQVGKAKDVAADYVATTRSYVEKHPLQSMAIAAATGAALGSLFSRGKRS